MTSESSTSARLTGSAHRLDGKVAVVTGASRGIGEASARALDDAGAQVVLTGRTTSDLYRVAAEMSHDPVVLTADLAPAGAGTDLARRILGEVDGVDVLVNNAGIPMRRTPVQLTEADFDLVFSINVRSLVMLSIGLAPSMIARGGGSVINISSVAGVHGPLGRVAYAGTKGAVDAMTRSLAADWGPDGIRVNSIAPGLIATAIWEEARNSVPGLVDDLAGQIALKRWGFGDDIADVVLFFASDASRYVTGETLVVDGGMARVSASNAPPALPELQD
ncbi:SDR family NAD(P)-dependent oxidoreductase [Candidatus Poriferisodalis sp.]|uniref:SDR family NAD(P)-dependent oxidoreductase n=1 Tax=Candidatus Poriferisodalis sp. TaxID=3101277 RepID=UPI003B51AF88